MKKTTLKLFSLLLFASAFFVSCGKDDENTETVEYYVEYHASYGGGAWWVTTPTRISYGTPTGSKSTTITRGQDFSVTAGPFKKGDRTYISGNAPTSSARSSISVKKGNSPFVQKAESTTSLSCSYTIDF
jgi:hypothetical protein